MFVFLLIILNLMFGFFLFVLKEDVIEFDMGVEDVVKLVILVGFVSLDYLDFVEGVVSDFVDLERLK